ncbi:hypothetical protein [Actinoplanes sp. NPDC049118]|uniref:hypothetical protein n=1 Tax=Actinoplanes sp. NPDC049118 TaxID=3155769 RepID=UPI0033EFB4BD
MPGPDLDSEPPAGAPGTVHAAAILLYVGGALTLVFALTSGARGSLLRSAAYVLIGLLYLGLARAVQRGRRWARRAVLVLCGAGVALAGFRLFDSGISAAAGDLAWPMVYAILLSTDAARSWFRAEG